MTDRIAFWLGIVVIAAILFDVVMLGGDNLVFLGKKFLELVEWLAFWR